MSFENVLPTGRKFRRPETEDTDSELIKRPSSSKLGCEYCPLNGVAGIKKIFGEVEGKDIFVWAQSPGLDENREGRELVGRSGKFLWTELGRVGITRDMCDIQNVVRCLPADRVEDVWPPLKMRNPSKEEIKCCSIYTKAAIERQRAKLHLVFGEIAQKAVLGQEYKKDRKVFWSEKLNGNVVCLAHPAYFIRMGYGGESNPKPNTQLVEFRARLDDLSRLSGMGTDRYTYLKEMDYVGVTSRLMASSAYYEIKEAAKKGYRVAVDIEDGILKSGNRRVLCIGFCSKAGRVFVFPIHHRIGLDITADVRERNQLIVKKILGDPEIKKVFHHGSYDVLELGKKLGVEVEGFDYDTEFGEYFFNPDAKAFGLQAIADRRYPEFAGYKEIICPEAMTPEFLQTLSKNTKLTEAKKFDLAKRKNGLNHALVPWKKLMLYNGADCDLTKRVEVSTRKSVNLPLMYVYRDAAILLAKMEKDGPLFDYQQHRRLSKLYPIRVQNTLRKLREIAGDEKFNPASPAQVGKLLFRTLGLEVPGGGKENTRVETLEMMKDDCEAAKLELDYRGDAKIESTYLAAFLLSADMHEGKLTTKWWLTGTRTGRLSSGKGKDAEAQAKGLVNLQNIVSDAQLQDMVISDEGWRDVYEWWLENGDFTEETAKQFEDLDVLLGFDEAQFEIRVVAQRSGDKELIAAFERGDDIHADVGSKLMGLPYESLLDEGPERVAVKGMHFGIIYGLKEKRLALNINAEYKKRGMKKRVTVEWARDLLDKYFGMYRKVKEMIEADQRQAEELGYVETMLGFRRPINVQEQKELGDEWEGAYWANQASNTPIQGTAHQLMLLGFVNLLRQKEKYRLLQRPKMEVHDALYFYVKLKNLWKAIPLGIEMLEEEPVRMARKEFGIDWKVPLKAEPKAGFRFGVMAKDLGGKKGPKTTSEFLNAWCEKNKKVEGELREEFRKLKNKVSEF